MVGCWRGYLSGSRCRLAYGPADATATHRLSCFSKIQIGFTFLVPAHPGSPGQRAVKCVCVCVCVSLCVCVLHNQGSMPVSFAVGCAVIPAGGRLVISPVQIVVATQAGRAVSVRSQRNNPHVEIENGFVANYINNGPGWHSDLQTTSQQTAFWTVYFTSHPPHTLDSNGSKNNDKHH